MQQLYCLSFFYCISDFTLIEVDFGIKLIKINPAKFT